jgi:SAM-dependent methyltransferase
VCISDSGNGGRRRCQEVTAVRPAKSTKIVEVEADQLAVAAARMSSRTRCKARSMRNFRRSDRLNLRFSEKIGHQAKALSALTIRRIRLRPELYRARRSARPGARCHGKRRFQVATAKEYPERDFDLVAFFDCLHDRADPAGAAAHVRQPLKRDGSCMIVEPMPDDKLE